MLLYITHHENECANCGEPIPAEAHAYAQRDGSLLCEGCRDTLPPDETTPEEEGVDHE